jgi:hypothetical protein
MYGTPIAVPDFNAAALKNRIVNIELGAAAGTGCVTLANGVCETGLRERSNNWNDNQSQDSHHLAFNSGKIEPPFKLICQMI